MEQKPYKHSSEIEESYLEKLRKRCLTKDMHNLFFDEEIGKKELLKDVSDDRQEEN